MPIITKKIDSTSVKEIWFPKVTYALLKSLLPKALEIIELPPIPIPIPIDDIKKTIGKTTVTAAMAIEPIH